MVDFIFHILWFVLIAWNSAFQVISPVDDAHNNFFFFFGIDSFILRSSACFYFQNLYIFYKIFFHFLYFLSDFSPHPDLYFADQFIYIINSSSDIASTVLSMGSVSGVSWFVWEDFFLWIFYMSLSIHLNIWFWGIRVSAVCTYNVPVCFQ